MRLKGLVYRAHNPRWSFAPTSGDGAALHGGRFNPKGTPALYTSLRPETAWLEAQQAFPFKPQPLTLCAYDVDCADVANLTDAEERARLNVTLGDLACPWELLASQGEEPPSWHLARRLMAEGIAGIIVESFAPGAGQAAGFPHRNAIFWRWSGRPPHRVTIIDDFGRLPRDGMSWRQ
ncbi:RES family NAD+ phosphorylase [Caenispirillum salinarum]|uniref:RES family NAD+ phosphorylase n=1 Tax=Caenispirillum salinarum TaxID=859058 RepID=UPI00384DD823